MMAWLAWADQSLVVLNAWLRRITLYVSIAGFWLVGFGFVHLPLDVVALVAFGAMWITMRKSFTRCQASRRASVGFAVPTSTLRQLMLGRGLMEKFTLLRRARHLSSSARRSGRY